MIAYNKIWMDNLEVNQDLQHLRFLSSITKEEQVAANQLHPVGFYTPNVFIRVGLFILTVIIVSLSFGLISLLTVSGNYEESIATICLIFGLLNYIILELMIKSKNYYQAGVDDALLWMSAILIMIGINMIVFLPNLINAAIIFCLSLYFSIRFADRLMVITAVLSLLAILFFTLTGIGNIEIAIAPFSLMLLAAAIYFVSKHLSGKESLRIYNSCFIIAEATALICLYIAGNYFVVQEVHNDFFTVEVQDQNTIPFAWLFWIFTVSLPVIYILAGIRKKDSLLIRTGTILIAAIVFTVRYYHSLLSIETLMVVAGLILLAVSYSLIKFLKKPRAGFTSEDISGGKSGINLEALLIAETLSANSESPVRTDFGGGDFGGGGASGSY